MPQAARITDAVAGTTAGEHTGHVPPHSPEQFSGEISGACSGTVRINGLAAATVGSITTERDGCCATMKKLCALLTAAALALTMLSACGTDVQDGQSSTVNSTVSRMPRTVVAL